MNRLKYKNVLFIGDPILKIMGLACGAKVIEVHPDTCETPPDIEKILADTGVVVIDERVYDRCGKLKNLLDSLEESILIVKIPPPDKLIEPKKYYEELIRKAIGLKISL